MDQIMAVKMIRNVEIAGVIQEEGSQVEVDAEDSENFYVYFGDGLYVPVIKDKDAVVMR